MTTRKAALAEARSELQTALHALPARSRIKLLNDLLAQSICALIEEEAKAITALLPSAEGRTWLPIQPPRSRRDALLDLVAKRPGITTRDAAKAIDMMRNSCATTLSGMGTSGLIRNHAGGWWPVTRYKAKG